MKTTFLILFLFLSSAAISQENTFIEEELSINRHIDGTLLTPNNEEKSSLAIIIAGSGPTNRNGNQNFLKNNSLKKLAEGLTNNGISSFRYDKRIVKQIRQNNVDSNIMFDDFVTDAISVLDYFIEKKKYSKIFVVGHSQGSLVGILAAKGKADGFISLAGAGKSINEIIIEQVTKTAPIFIDDTKRVFEVLKSGNTTDDFPVALSSIFNKDIQPFMINWMQYNPQDEINKLEMPCLIINGTKDLQVTVDEAKLLSEAALKTSLKIIENMNHVLFIIEGDDLENSKSYNESFRPIAPELINEIVNFINSER